MKTQKTNRARSSSPSPEKKSCTNNAINVLSQCSIKKTIQAAFERESNSAVNPFWTFFAGSAGFGTSNRKLAMFFDGFFGRLWTLVLAILITSLPSCSSVITRLKFSEVLMISIAIMIIGAIDCRLRIKCVQGYEMSFAAIVDAMTVMMIPVLPVVREFVLYEQSRGKRRDDTLTYSFKAFFVGFTEFLFLTRLCIAGAQFLSARWEGKNGKYGGTESGKKGNASAAGVFRRLEQAGAANIALLVATTVTLGPIASGGEKSVALVRNYAYYGVDVDNSRAMRRLMEAGLALVASALFNALFISMRLHLLGKPFDRIIEILERHARAILADLESNESEGMFGVAGSLDISVLAYVLEKMSDTVNNYNSEMLRKRSIGSSHGGGDSPAKNSTNQLLIQAILLDHSIFAGQEVDDSTKAWLKSYDVNSVTRLGTSVTHATKSRIHAFASAVTKMAGAQKVANALSSDTIIQNSSSSLSVFTEEEKLELDSWDFKVFEYGVKSNTSAGLSKTNEYTKAHSFVVEMFKELSLLPSVVEESVLRVFVGEVAKMYRENPYHNFTHALDVTHTTFRYIKMTKSRTKITKLEKFALMVAAIVHDMDHPGLTNAFLVRTRDGLATTYNDQSVLENYHLAHFFNLIEANQSANIFATFSDESYREVRRIIIACVMHTDMAQHFSMVSKMDEFVHSHDFLEALDEEEDCDDAAADAANGDDENNEIDGSDDQVLNKETDKGAFFKTDDERQLMLNVLLHSADISNAVKPFPTYNAWATRVLEEFFNQGDREKILGLPVSPMMDRNTTVVSISQINFIEFVVAPLYSAFSKMFPETRSMCLELVENRRIWQERLEQEIMEDKNKSDTQKRSEREAFEKRFRGLIDKHFSRTNAFKNAEDPIAKRILSTPPQSRRGSGISPITSALGTPTRKRSLFLDSSADVAASPQSLASSDSFVSMLSKALTSAKQKANNKDEDYTTNNNNNTP